MTDDTSRLKEKVEKLEDDNVKLIELVKQRDAKMFEMKNEVNIAITVLSLYVYSHETAQVFA